MNNYVGTKLVKAIPMTRIQYNHYRGWTLPDNELHLANDEGFLVEYLDGGEANHPAHEGYISWSPATVFINSYKQSGELSFGAAMEHASMGAKIARKGWNGSGMYAVIMPGYPEGVPANAITARVHGVSEGSLLKVRPYWVLKTAQDDLAMWAPSGSDTLAEDWCIV